MSALAFTGCNKSSPSGYMSESGKIVKKYCDANPGVEACVYLVDKTELSPQEVKPVMKLMKDSLDKLYGASSPSLWALGYSDLPISDNGTNIPYTLNFSVERNSVLKVGMEMEYSVFNATTGLFDDAYHDHLKISAIEGGDKSNTFFSRDKGNILLQVVSFRTIRKYFFLPPLRFAP